jgi:hypothetical protein
MICVAIAALGISVTSAAAVEMPKYDGSLEFPTIHGPTAPEEYPFRVELQPEETLTQLNKTEAEVVYEGLIVMGRIKAMPAHDNTGTAVPTSLSVTAPDIVTEIVHHQPSDPASGGASFAYPITAGEPFTPGPSTVTVVVPMVNPLGEPVAAKTTCTVPALRGLGLRGAKNKLRAAHCGIGEVHLAAGATAAKGKVVKQFRAAGTELAAGAPVAVKVGSR